MSGNEKEIENHQYENDLSPLENAIGEWHFKKKQEREDCK
jgi:hypothetical protein